MREKAKILIVEQSPAEWESARQFLESNGLQILLAESFEQSLSLARARNPDLVLVTTHLPGGDLQELCRLIKSLPGLDRVYVCMVLDGQNNEHPRPEAEDNWVDDYLVRPINHNDLLFRLKKMLRQRKAREDIRQKGEQLHQSLEEMSAFNLIGQQINLALSLDEILPKVVDQVFATLQPDRAFIFLLEDGKLRLKANRVNGEVEDDGERPSLCAGECLCGLALQDGKSKFSRNLYEDERCTRTGCKQVGMLSIAALPLRVGQDVFGVLGLCSREEQDFESKSVFFEALSAQVSMGVQNARLYGSVQNELKEREHLGGILRAKNEFLEAMHETTLELVSEHNLATLLMNIVKRAGQLVGTDTGEIDLVDEQVKRLIPQVVLGAVSDVKWLESGFGEGVAGHVWQSGKPFIVDDYDEWAGHMQQFPKGRVGAVAAVPLISEESVIGVLMVSYPRPLNRKFEPGTVDLLVQFGRLATLAITNSRLFSDLQQELVEHNQAEQALQASEREFRSVVEFSPLAMHFYQLESPGVLVLKDLNGAAEKLSNGSRLTLIGMRLEDLLQGLKGTRYPDLFCQVARGDVGPQVFEIQYKDEHFRGFIEIHVYQINSGRILTELIDITERKRVEMGLQESEFLLRESQRIGRIGSYNLDITTDSWVCSEG